MKEVGMMNEATSSFFDDGKQEVEGTCISERAPQNPRRRAA